MGESYCGKSCDSCPVREPENCPGCKNGPGSPWSGECELARCCRDKGHDSCNTCNLSYQCSMYNNREWQPDYRARRRSDNAAMIAAQGYYEYLDGNVADLTLNGLPTLNIDYR